MKISPSHRPRVVVTALLDGLNDKDLEGAAARDVDQFRKAEAQDPEFKFSGTVFRQGLKISGWDVAIWAGKTVAAVGLGVAATLTSPLYGGLATAAAAGWALFPGEDGSFARNWFSAGKMGLAHYRNFQGDDQPGQLEAEQGQLQKVDTPEKVSLDGWQAQLTKNMKTYPTAHHVVFALGHGLGYESMAEMPTGHWAEAMESSSQDAARRPDVMVLESCNMANLEALAQMRRAASFVVASPEPVQTTNGLSQALTRVTGDSPRELGTELVEKLSRDRGLDELGLFDLEALDQKLLPDLDKVAGKLRNGLDAERAEKLVKLLEQTEKSGQEGLEFRDLGDFLNRVKRLELGAAKEAQAALSLTELTEGTDGLSFRPFPGLGGEGQRYEDLDLPEQWKSLFLELNYFRLTGKLPSAAPAN